jgi:hypothetical protein
MHAYKATYHCHLNLEELGYGSAKDAAHVLLFDIGKIVQGDDTDNPVVAVDEDIALTPRPGAFASWPSLYEVLCKAIPQHSSIGPHGHEILLSKAKPLIEAHWHSNFEDSGLYWFTQNGSKVALKKMKHVMHALIDYWRRDFLKWRDSSQGFRSGIDEAVRRELWLIPSATKNDLLLCTPCMEVVGTSCTESVCREPAKIGSGMPPCTNCTDNILERTDGAGHEAMQLSDCQKLSEPWTLEDFDNPRCPFPLDDCFEPPPQSPNPSWGRTTASCSSYEGDSSSLTPFSLSSPSHATSGYATPVPVTGWLAVPLPQGPIGESSNWAPLLSVPNCSAAHVQGWLQAVQNIPTGVVQNVRSVFEAHSSIPSWYAQQQ